MPEQPSRHIHTMRPRTTYPGLHILVAAFIALAAMSLGAYSSGLLDGTQSTLLSLSSVSVISGLAALNRMLRSHRLPLAQPLERERRDDARSR